MLPDQQPRNTIHRSSGESLAAHSVDCLQSRVGIVDRIGIKFGRVDELEKVITHAKFEVNQYIIVNLMRDESFMF